MFYKNFSAEEALEYMAYAVFKRHMEDNPELSENSKITIEITEDNTFDVFVIDDDSESN